MPHFRWREEGTTKAPAEAAGGETLDGEITSGSAKCTVIFPPRTLQENNQGPSLLGFSERFLVSRFFILSNSLWSLRFIKR